ncbi:MATE family efflux transporter [Candidatus Babeliales bacterium]|nr:MATE family efflux transporter [Candidatus Babeliales bacterium]
MNQKGESYRQLLGYWAPEMVTMAVLNTLPLLFDAYVIAQLKSTSTYGTLGIVNNFLHMLMKLAESVSVATIALVGRYNGAKDYKRVGSTLGDAFWTTLVIGAVPSLLLFSFSTEILVALDVPKHMAILGSPFLKLRSLGVFLLFINLAFLGFMRGVKNTKTPMKIYIVGISIFMVFDYILVLGKVGLPARGLTGSAIATLIQYSVMIVMSTWHILRTEKYKIYFSKAFYYFFSKEGIIKIITLSIPILIDKAALSSAYVRLNQVINPMGKYAIASFTLIKDLERLAFLPAIAFATVITFLVSNRLGAGDQEGARANIRKVLYLAGGMVAVGLFVISVNPAFFAEVFDPRKKFSSFAGAAFPFISLLVVFDFIQLILAGVLRGAGDVKTVMWIRFCTCFFFFYPVSKFISTLPIENELLKFILIYGSFYLNTGLMGLLFIFRLKSKRWSTTKI